MLTDKEKERRNARYFWDTRRTTDDPETEGYGYDFDRMFRDLEAAEAVIRKYRIANPELADSKRE